MHVGWGQRQPGAGDRHHQQAECRKVGGKGPARDADVGHVLAFDRTDLELARQAQRGGEGEQGLAEEGQGQHVVAVDRQRAGERGWCGIAQQNPGEQADREEGEQLDQRLQRDGEHQSVVVLGDVHRASAEQDREQRQRQRDPEGAVRDPCVAADRSRARHHFEAHRQRLELQRDVGHRGGERDQGDQGREVLALAVARGDEVGDRGDVALVGDRHHATEHAAKGDEQQCRAEVDREVVDARRGRAAHRAVKCPRRAVNGQRQRIHVRAQPAVGRIQRPAIARPGDREQHAQIGDADRDQRETAEHAGTLPARAYNSERGDGPPDAPLRSRTTRSRQGGNARPGSFRSGRRLRNEGCTTPGARFAPCPGTPAPPACPRRSGCAAAIRRKWRAPQAG